MQDLDHGRPVGERPSDGSATIDPTGKSAQARGPHGDEDAGRQRLWELPCKVEIKSRGIQWFIYNRTPAYDAILGSLMGERDLDDGNSSPSQASSQQSGMDARKPADGHIDGPPREQSDGSKGDMKRATLDSTPSVSSASPSSPGADQPTSAMPSLLSVLPVGIKCSKGAIVMGNQSTRSILTAKFDGATGKIDARMSRAVDQYKQSIDVDFTHPVIQFKENKDYKDTTAKEGARICSERDQGLLHKPSWSERLNYRQRIQKTRRLIQDYLPYRRGSVESLTHPHTKSVENSNTPGRDAGAYMQQRWLGLNRYLDDDEDRLVEQGRWRSIEYAQFPTIVDSPGIAASIYWDVPGNVPDPSEDSSQPPGFEQDINGDAPPDWGIDLKIRGGTVNYGPWADRQRADLQAVFFPPLYKDVTPARRLLPGESRVSTVLKIVLEIEQQISLRIPTREDSKDWKWKSRPNPSTARGTKHRRRKPQAKGKGGQDANQSPEFRSSGWLDITVLPDSTVHFAMDLFAKSSGYHNHVDVDFRGLEISSSLNHGLLWRSHSQTISCDLSNPLGWNALREWKIDIKDRGLELFLLRDHIFLLTDLISDWASGPPSDFRTFVPFEYSLSLHVENFRLYLNANDSNVIDNPADVDDNTFLIVWGNELIADLFIPMKNFRPSRSSVSFDVEGRNGGFETRAPPWKTQHIFLESGDVAALKDLKVDGSYNFSTDTSPTLTDTLLLNVYGASPRIELHGFLIRHLMNIKDNYFGDDMHFRTLEEYQRQLNEGKNQDAEDANSEHNSRTRNDLDVILRINADNSRALLPAHLYSATENITIEIESVSADLRITNYYMDLAIAFSPLAISQTSREKSSDPASEVLSETQIFIDGLEVLGHRLFGLPPAEPTYVCNWDFDVGSVSGECTVAFVHRLMQSVQCFGLSFDDDENVLPSITSAVLHDVTLLRAKLNSIRVGLHVEEAAFILSTEEIKVEFNDWAGPRFSDRMHALIPALSLAIVSSHGDSGERGQATKTHAYVEITIELNKIKRKLDFRTDRQSQQSHIAAHDARTQRVPWLIHASDHVDQAPTSTGPSKLRPPALPIPLMPEPLACPQRVDDREAHSFSSTTKSDNTKSSSSRKSSFLARSSSNGIEERRHQSSSRKQSPRIISPPTASGLTQSFRVSKIHNKQQFNSKHPGFAFSSPYKRPDFPLLATEADTAEVPQMPNHLARDELVTEPGYLEGLKSEATDQDSEQASFMVHLNEGIRALCTPEALLLVTQMQEQLQTNEIVALLDGLQTAAVTEVMKLDKQRKSGSQIVEFRIYSPFIRARFDSTSRTMSGDASIHERYDVLLDNFAATIRSSDVVPKDVDAIISHRLSLHARLDLASCTAKESGDADHGDQAVISFSVYEPVFWMFQGTATSAEVQFRDLEIASASRKVDYISSLIRHTVVLFENMTKRFSSIAQKRLSRLRLLVLLLSKEGDDIPDPMALSGASYVLRSASKHLRSSDSWKMVCRLRYVYKCLPQHAQDRILAQCRHKWASCPTDAHSIVIANFERWRNWDLAHVRSSVLMQKVYGQLLRSVPEDYGSAAPLRASLRAGTIRVLVEPGPNQNEVAVERLAIGFEMNHAPPETRLVVESPTPTSVIQAHCAKAAVVLNWSLCELLEDVLKTMQSTQISVSKAKTPISAVRSPNKQLCLHLTISTETSVLQIDTINIRTITLCQGLKSSIISLEDTRDNSSSGLLSLAIGADALKSEIRSHSTTLTAYNLRKANVLGSRSSKSQGEAESRWKFVGSSRDIRFETHENPLEIIEVARKFLKDEVSQFHEWSNSLQPAPSPPSLLVSPSRPPTVPKVHVALFVDSYLISVTVISSLTYRIYGKGARTSLESGLGPVQEVRLDMDLKQHSHVFKSSADSSDELSALQIAPINGRLTLGLASQQNSIFLRIIAEPIVLDASAVHAMFNAVHRPEITSLVRSMRHDLSVFPKHLETIFEMKKQYSVQTSPSPSATTLWDADATAAGLAIHAHTPDSAELGQSVQLKVDMGRIRLKTTNRDPSHGGVMQFPELEAQLNKISIDLTRSEKQDLRSCGSFLTSVGFRGTSKINESGQLVRAYQVASSRLETNLCTETASATVAILRHLQDTLKTVDLSNEVRGLRNLRLSKIRGEVPVSCPDTSKKADYASVTSALFSATLEMTNIRVVWKIGTSISLSATREAEDLVLSFSKIDLATRRGNAARLLIENLQLQMAPASRALADRSLNSALLPELVFNVAYRSTEHDRRLAFQAVGKSLDLRITSQSILPANDLRRSIALASAQIRAATAHWNALANSSDGQMKSLLGNKKFVSLLVDADFAGAVVYIQGRNVADPRSLALTVIRGVRLPQHGRYNQFTPENADSSSTVLKSPGVALKVEYKDVDADERSLNAEIKIDASSNVLYPTVVPLIMEMSASVKEIVGEPGESQKKQEPKVPPSNILEDERLRTADPSALLGNCKLNLGLRICKQEFSLSCQPIARVAATARFDDIYIATNTVQSPQHGKFFTMSAAFTRLQMSVQHIYSRESTGSLDVESIVISFMNSKHVSATHGISVILNVSPIKAQMNAKQSQDFLLFREIWVPPEIRQASTSPEPPPASESHAYIVQRYQQVSAAGAFPWNATVSVSELDIQLDLGQSLGKSTFMVSSFWVSSKKSSDWEQNLCLGFDKVAIDSTGRMSGLVELQNFRVRTSIQWPIFGKIHDQAPLVQASLGFDHLRIKAGFDYQTFLVADVSTFEFLMYNVRDSHQRGRDRLVGVLDGEKVQVFCSTTSASLALALFQAFQRLILEKQAAYETLLKDIEKFLRRKSSVNPTALRAAVQSQANAEPPTLRSQLRLHTDVVITLKAVNLGMFPNTFFDNQIFKTEALDASARFAVVLDGEKIHSTLGMTLGQLRVALSGINRATVPKTLGEVSVSDVVTCATGSRGGTILKVPRVIASMQTWQETESTQIDYIFKSSFQGKVDVGWNYSRISYIRGMWTTHARALAQRLGKPLPQSAVQITGGPRPEGETEDEGAGEGEGVQEKITAVVNVPQSKYQYRALEPAIIETPQLRDMGDATPPLEWIGLQRDRLPNLTHQIVIVSLLEVAREVDDAYSMILGSS